MQTVLEDRAIENGAATRGVLVGFTGSGEPLVDYRYPEEFSRVAVSTAVLTAQDVGREVVLLFENGNPASPIIVGVIRPAAKHSPVDVTVDGKRLMITAQEQIVLRCGQASITLTRAGKVLIKGAYVSNRSSGANRIKGGSIQLN